MHFFRCRRTIGGMLPALRLPLLTLGVLLISVPAATAAGPSIPVPAEGQVSVTFASGVKSVKVKSAPAGVTVAGGVKGGKLVVAVVRPRGAQAAGKVVLTVKGKAKGTKTIGAALNGGKAPNCKDLAALASKRLKGTADVKGLGAVLAAKLCGKAAPGDANAVLSRLGLGAPAQPAPGAGNPAPAPSIGGGTVKPTPTPNPGGGGGKVCGNGVDDDKDGQTDLDDPGCADGNDATETGEVAVSADCMNNGSGVSKNGEPQARSARSTAAVTSRRSASTSLRASPRARRWPAARTGTASPPAAPTRSRPPRTASRSTRWTCR